MKRYDPAHAPLSDPWLALDEGERIRLVEQFHRAARIRVPNQLAHAVFHVVVENQLALPDQAVVRQTMQRLLKEGLSRHEAIHAIASVLAVQVHDLLQPVAPAADSEARYHADLGRLTAEVWRSGQSSEE